MDTIDITKCHFVYQLYRKGTDVLVGAVSTWHESSDDMLARANDLFRQGFDVRVRYGGVLTCHTTTQW